ncbi:MAG: MOSC domain-containing protein, partial [Anaerolineae bacterium]
MTQAMIFQINISHGGVPKLAVRSAEVTELGLVGDTHNNTKVHGGPTRALCLYSLERILALQAEGHPIFAGSTGENLTLAGLD